MAKNENKRSWRDKAPETIEIGCMNRAAHHDVPYWFTAERGKPATCPGCGRGN